MLLSSTVADLPPSVKWHLVLSQLVGACERIGEEFKIDRARTQKMLTRVYRVRYSSSEGKCFSMDSDCRQYLITAKHVWTGFEMMMS